MTRLAGCSLAALALLLGGCERAPPGSAGIPAATSASAASAGPAGSAATVAARPASAAPLLTRAASEVPAIAWPGAAERQAGAQLAAQGAQGIAACAGCHGAAGEGQAGAGFPRLAGQSFDYLQRQLEAYAAGQRRHPVMQPIAQAMSPAQRRAGAAFYATQAASAAAPAGAASAAPGSRGARLARAGDEAHRVQACANCHGTQGEGRAGGIPYLAGQQASYLEASLAAWRDGARDTDPSGSMPVVAKSLAAGDARALAEYYAALKAPAAPLDAPAPAPVLAAASAVVSGPVSGTAGGATGGTGPDPSATGGQGNQGPGGAGAPGGSASAPGR